MSDKRKIQRFNLDEGRIWEAIEGLSPFETTYTLEEVCEKLNEQQATISALKEENDILKQKLRKNYIANKQYDEMKRLQKENEQQERRIEVLENLLTNMGVKWVGDDD